ncbi:MAG: sugar ABC transporter substrate-binding protein [Inquilinus sp.]|nr:sugar ABC transporter substrate-binding protein [Inquilinus sp.]
MKIISRTIAAAALATAAIASPALAQEDIRIVVVSHGQASDPFWSVVKNGVDTAQADMGVTVEYLAPDTFNMVRMAQLIDAAVASAPDGLVVSIPDADALGASIRDAIASGIPVISMNSGSDVRKGLGVSVHVGQTEYEAGVGGGERMAAAGVSKAICINQEVGNVALDLRCQGFTDGLGGSVEVLAVSMDPTEIRNQVIAYLTRNQDTEAVLTLGPSAAEPTLAALEEEGLIGSIKLGTFDLSPTVLQALDAGQMEFAIDQQQFMQGYLPVVLLTLNHKYGLMPGADVLTGPGFVTPANAAQVIELSAQGIR